MNVRSVGRGLDLRALEASARLIAPKKVCALLLPGGSHPRIALGLGVSQDTVTDPIRKLHRKFDLQSVDELRAHFETAGAAVGTARDMGTFQDDRQGIR